MKAAWLGKRMSLYSKAAMILLVAACAFNLGRYSVEFSGRPAGWIAVILFIGALGFSAYALLFGA